MSVPRATSYFLALRVFVSNLEKHGIDFLDAALILTKPHLSRKSDRKGESRWIAIGPLPEDTAPSHWSSPLCVVVYTKREDTYRIISARRARNDEREAYRTKIAEGN